MGMNVGRNHVGNLPQMKEVAKTELAGIEQKPQTVKETDVKFPEEKPDVQKTIYDESIVDRLGDGVVLKPGDRIKHKDGSETIILSPSSCNGEIGRHRNFPAPK